MVIAALLGSFALGGAAPAPPASSPPKAAAAANPADPEVIDSVVSMLLDRGEFWDQRGQANVANGFFQRALTLQPDNVRALAGAAQAALHTSQPADAEHYVEHLRKLAPNDPFLVQYQIDKSRTDADKAALYNGRKLYAAGKYDEALVEYRKLLKDGHIPQDLAVEYYPLYLTTLPPDSADIYDTFAEFGEIAKSAPQNYVLQFAYAQAMVNNEGQREAGIDRLRDLSNIPSISAQVRRAWRQALLWQGADFRPQEQLEEYLKTNPSDPEIEAKRADFKAVLLSDARRADLEGDQKFNTGDVAGAEVQFKRALGTEPDDAFANIMLAVIYRRQGRADWRPYYERAVKGAPDRKHEFDLDLGIDPETNAKAAAEGARAAQARFKAVSGLTDAGQYAEAEAMMKDLMRQGRDAGTVAMLADIQMRAGESDAAVASLREAVRLDPKNAYAQFALCAALVQTKAVSEALQHCDQADTLYRAAQDQHGAAAVSDIRAGLVLSNAMAQDDLTKREAQLKGALAQDPSNVWFRVNLARTQADLGDQAASRQTIAPILSAALGQAGDPKIDVSNAQNAGFLWAQGHKDYQTAAQIAEKVPAAQRSESMRLLLELTASRSHALALAGQPDPTGERGAIIGGLLIQDRNFVDLRRALLLSLQKTSRPTNRQYTTYAGLLMQGNQTDAARDMLAQLDVKSLSVDQRVAANEMIDSLVVNQADQLVQDHHLPEALQLVQARRALAPHSTAMKIEWARVQIAQGNAAGVLPDLLAEVAKDPENLPARFGAIDAAIGANQLSLADHLATDGATISPHDPILALRVANVAQLRGDNGRALIAFKRARELRQSQVGADTRVSSSN